jgi:hypothetical protein
MCDCNQECEVCPEFESCSTDDLKYQEWGKEPLFYIEEEE